MSIVSLIIALADTYCFLIFVYVMMSWLPIGGMVDISPIIAFFVLQFGVRLIVSLF